MATHAPAFASSAPLRLGVARAPRCGRRCTVAAVAVDRGNTAFGGQDRQMQRRLGIRDPWDEGRARRRGARAGEAGFHSIHIPLTLRGDLEDDAVEEEGDMGGGVAHHAAAAAAAAPPRHAAAARHGGGHAGALHGTSVDDLNALPSADDEDAPPPAKPWDSTSGVHGISYLGRRVAFLRKRTALVNRSYEECRRITELFSKTFYMGTTLMPPEKRKAIWAVYTWCRRTDELVDGPRVSQRSASLNVVLQDWRARLDALFAKGKAIDELDLALVDVCNNYPDLTIEPFLEMVNGMQMDVDMSRFETWDDLYLYCYRVAGTVGLMSLPIMGTVKPGRDGLREASEAALALGIGLQLTNILRDVGEDRLRGRIYLPLEDLRRFNYTEDDLMACVNDARYKALMRFQIDRARKYFARAHAGIQLLNPDARLPVQASLDMYSQILDVLEDNDYDNFHRRAYISKTQKMLTIPLSSLRVSEHPAARAALSAMAWLEEKRLGVR